MFIISIQACWSPKYKEKVLSFFEKRYVYKYQLLYQDLLNVDGTFELYLSAYSQHISCHTELY